MGRSHKIQFQAKSNVKTCACLRLRSGPGRVGYYHDHMITWIPASLLYIIISTPLVLFVGEQEGQFVQKEVRQPVNPGLQRLSSEEASPFSLTAPTTNCPTRDYANSTRTLAPNCHNEGHIVEYMLCSLSTTNRIFVSDLSMPHIFIPISRSLLAVIAISPRSPVCVGPWENSQALFILGDLEDLQDESGPTR